MPRDHQGVFDQPGRDWFNNLLADVAEIRTQFAALTAKLDLDTGVNDTDYNTLDPAAATAEGNWD